MITHIRTSQTISLVAIVAMLILGVMFLFPAVNYASSEPETQSTTKKTEKTLIRMRQGGIYDQLGFGFHRYATDAQWLVPHFEKMLYDQALLIMAYTEAYQATEKAFYANVAEEIISYVLRDMTSTEGGFLSAEDSDSEGIELNRHMLAAGTSKMAGYI